MGRGSSGLAEYMNRSQVKEVTVIDKMALEDTSIRDAYAQMTETTQVFSEGETLADKFGTLGDNLSSEYSRQYQTDEVFRDQNASRREKKRKASEYNKKIDNARVAPAKIHAKLTALAEQFAQKSDLFDTSSYNLPANLQRLMDADFSVLSLTMDESKINMLQRMKEEAPKMHRDLINMRLLMNRAVVRDEDVEISNYRKLLNGELAILEAQYNMVIQTVDKYINGTADYDMQFVDHDLVNQKVQYGGIPVMSDKYRSNLNDSMKPVIIDFSKDYDVELQKLHNDRDKAVREDKQELINELDKQIGTMYVIVKARDEAVRVAKKYGVEPQKVQQTILDYLKAMTANVDFRMKMSMGAFKAIALDRYKCKSGSEAYNEFVSKHFSANPGEDASGLIGFGYMGNGPTVDVTQRYDSTALYGSLTVTYRKNRVKDRTTFVLGNSRDRYDNMRARSVNNPDLLMCADEMENVYRRASRVMSGEAQLMTVEEESHHWGRSFNYAECQYHGRLSAGDIEKVSIRIEAKLSGLSDEEIVSLLRKKTEYRLGGAPGKFSELYEVVKVMNHNPNECETEAGAPIDIEACFDDGVLTLSDIDRLFMNYPAE